MAELTDLPFPASCRAVRIEIDHQTVEVVNINMLEETTQRHVDDRERDRELVITENAFIS